MAKDQVPDDFPAQHGAETHGPHGTHHCHGDRQGQHPSGFRQLHVGVDGVVEIIGQQPQRGAGPGADPPPQQRQGRQQQGVVEADAQKDGEADGQQAAQGERPAVGQQQQQRHKREDDGQQDRDAGDIAFLPLFRGRGIGIPLSRPVHAPGQGPGDKDGKQAPDKVFKGHRASLSSSSRSWASSSRLRPLSHRAAAKVDTLPPQSPRKKAPLWAAR